ncbi:MAG: hypothetical protein ACKV19_01210 [Verrucomicrobiales bacterium]
MALSRFPSKSSVNCGSIASDHDHSAATQSPGLSVSHGRGGLASAWPKLCQFQGKPFTVQVQSQPSSEEFVVPVQFVSWRVLPVAFLVLGIVLMVVLVRKA